MYRWNAFLSATTPPEIWRIISADGGSSRVSKVKETRSSLLALPPMILPGCASAGRQHPKATTMSIILISAPNNSWLELLYGLKIREVHFSSRRRLLCSDAKQRQADHQQYGQYTHWRGNANGTRYQPFPPGFGTRWADNLRLETGRR